MVTTRRRRGLRATVLAALVGGTLALLLVLGFVAAFGERNLPPLTADALANAEALWNEHGPANYNLDIKIGGRQPGVVHVEVRDGEPTAMTRDGFTPKQRRTWEPWTVRGQFDTLQRELDNAADPVKGFDAPTGAQVIERARFDPALGYPLKYERAVLGTPLEVAWEVEKFQMLEDAGPEKAD